MWSAPRAVAAIAAFVALLYLTGDRSKSWLPPTDFSLLRVAWEQRSWFGLWVTGIVLAECTLVYLATALLFDWLLARRKR